MKKLILIFVAISFITIACQRDEALIVLTAPVGVSPDYEEMVDSVSTNNE